jgi:carboxypeptidase family protein
MKTRTSRLLILLGAWALTLSPATPQELTSGTIAGRVADPAGKPISGALVIATSQSGTRTATTEGNGNYILPFLRPGEYTVRVEASGGFSTVIQNGVLVSLNQRTSLNFTLEPGKTETVTVTAAAPLIDIKSTSSGTNIKYDEFANAVPLGRAFTDTYTVAAGVVSGLGTGQGNYSIGGATGLENSYLIDGVNVTNTGFGGIGAYNIIYGSLGTGVTSEFLNEVQVKTGGFEAEYGQALGGIINTIVKSGTNDFKGSVAWYASPPGLYGPNQLVKLDSGFSNEITQDKNDFAFSLGGPVIKDKLFYFVAYNPVITIDRRQANLLTNPEFGPAQAGVPVFNNSLPTGFGATSTLAFPSATQELERRRTSDNYAVKLNWQASPGNLLELTFFGDPSTGDSGPQRDTAPQFTDFASGGGASKLTYGSNNGSLKWNSVFGPKFFMEAQIARHAGMFREDSVKNDYRYEDLRNNLEFRRCNGLTCTDPNGNPFTPSPVITDQGGIGFTTKQDDLNTQYQAKFTSVFGQHEVKYGVEFDDIGYRENASYTGPSFNVELPISFYNTTTHTIEPVDANGDGVQDFLPVPTRGGALVQVRNGTGAPNVVFDSPNRFRVVRARMGPELPFTPAKEEDAFLQDTWTITPRIVVKAGVRYTEERIDGAGTFTLPFGTQTVMNEVSPGNFVPTRIFTAGTSTYRPNRYSFAGNWAPRLGVSWDVLGNGKSSLYVNYGRYFERVPSDLAVRAFSNEVGISRQEFVNRDLTGPRTTPGTSQCVDTSGNATTANCSISAPVFTQGTDQTAVVGGVKLPYEDEISGGYRFEVTPASSFEVRAIFRNQGRVLEDTQVNAVEQIQNFYYGPAYGYPYDPFGGTPAKPNSSKFPATPFGTYFLANPGTRAIPSGLQPGINFPKPVRQYKALEMIYTRRFSNSWSMLASYTFSRLYGNYEGLYRNDNGQSDPNITSLYDFPNSPLMSGQFLQGALPSDVTHVLRVFPSYQFADRLRVGAGFSWYSGVPRTSLLAHPIYQNAGEIPGIDPVYGYWVDPVGAGNPSDFRVRSTSNLSQALADPQSVSGAVFLKSYTPVERGNLGRTPDLVSLDLHADYPIIVGKSTFRLMFDVFNVFQTQEPTQFDDDIELTAGVTDPDFLKPIAYQSPRTWRLAGRWDF